MARRDEKNLMKSSSEYSYVADQFVGVDFTTLDGKCDDHRLPYLVNMYRDKEKADGAALETFPGFRLLPKVLGDEEAEIFGIFSHRFTVDGKKKDCLILHKGEGLYVFSHEEREKTDRLTSIATVKAGKSQGFSFGEDFIFLDGKTLWRLSSPTEAVALGDGPYTEAMLSLGQYPETNAYIPTVTLDGEPYEERNLLSDYYEVKRRFTKDEVALDSHGLTFAPITYEGKEALAVTGIEAGRETVFVPETALYEGKSLPIVRIAPYAFSGKSVRTAILSPSVKELCGTKGVGDGVFYGCSSLETVVLHGVVTVGPDAFALCPSLKTVVFGKDLKSVDASAFYGCSGLESVYFGASEVPSLDTVFGSSVTVVANALLMWQTVGDTIRIPCDTDAIQKVFTLYGAEHDALTAFEEYNGIYDPISGFSGGYSARCKHSAPLVECYFRGFGVEELSKRLFLTVTEDSGLCVYQDKVAAFRMTIPNGCKAVVSVTVDGVVCDDTDVKYTEERVGDLVSALVITFPYGKWADREVVIRCFGEGQAGLLPSGTLQGCRLVTAFDGRLFFGGNPDHPDKIFYSLLPRDKASCKDSTGLYVGASSYLSLKERAGTVVSLLATPGYLAVLKGDPSHGGSIFYLTKDTKEAYGHALYTVKGSSGAPLPLGPSLCLGDKPLFLSERGLFAIAPGGYDEEDRLENRSYYIDGALLLEKELSLATLASWKGYLVLLTNGKIFLGDPEGVSKEKGTRQFEWFYLADIGNYRGQVKCYRHLQSTPYREGKALTSLTVAGKPLLVKGDRTPCDGTVYSALGEENGETTAITVFYTPEKDANGEEVCYLVEHDGEMRGGEFMAATAVAALGGVLYFGTKDGLIFCFNTDKRGVALTLGDAIFPVEADEIHNHWYTFNGRLYESGFATAFSDMGVPHVAKSTSPKSLVIKLKTMPHSSFTLSVRSEKGGFREVSSVVATDAYCEKDLTKESFSPEKGQFFTLHEREKRWVQKQFLLVSRNFRSPFGVDAIAYRYKMAGRIKG